VSVPAAARSALGLRQTNGAVRHQGLLPRGLKVSQRQGMHTRIRPFHCAMVAGAILTVRAATATQPLRASGRAPLRTIEPGDLVFRKGTSWAGRLVRTLDPHTEFSHVGIVVEAGPDPIVVHAVPPANGAGQGVLRERLSRFLMPRVAGGGSIWRPSRIPPNVRSRAAAMALDYFAQRLGFDTDFDLTTPERLYCTELVWRAYAAAGHDLTGGGRDTIKAPLFTREVVFPSTLLRSGLLTPVSLDFSRERSATAHD
jgi:hypothetical protein